MAYEDEQKLGIVRAAIVERLNEFTEWAVFKTFLQGLTQTQIKTFIINKLQQAQTDKSAQVVVIQGEETDLGELETEVSTDV